MPKRVSFRAANDEATVRLVSVMLYPKDKELMTGLAAIFGCSNSEIARTAIRHFAAHIGYLDSINKGETD